MRCTKPCRWSWRAYSCRPPAGVEVCEGGTQPSEDIQTPVAAVTLVMLLLFLLPLLLLSRRTAKPNHCRSARAASSSASRTTNSRSGTGHAAPIKTPVGSPVGSPIRSPANGNPIKSPFKLPANGTPSSRWGLPVSPAEAFLTSLIESQPPQSELLSAEELKCLPGMDHRWVRKDWGKSSGDRLAAGGLPKTWKATTRAALDQQRADEAPVLWVCRYCGKQVQLRSKLHPNDASARLERPSPAMMARLLTALPSPRAQIASPPGSSGSKPGAPSSGSGRAVKRTPTASSLSKTPVRSLRLD